VLQQQTKLMKRLSRTGLALALAVGIGVGGPEDYFSAGAPLGSKPRRVKASALGPDSRSNRSFASARSKTYFNKR